MKTTSSLSHQLGQMVDKPEYSDIVFLVGPEQTPVYASRVILVARSPVFAAQFMGSFKEALAPPSSTPTTSSAPSSPGPADTSDATTSVSPSPLPSPPSLPPLFWRSVPLLEVEPTIFRRLLHCLYTDQLPPSSNNRDAGDVIRDLVSLFAAADRFLVDRAKALVRDQLKRTVNKSNVLMAFDHALAVAPDLAHSLFLPIIEANAAKLLLMGNTGSNAAEAQWLAMSTAGAEAVVASNLSGLHEVDLFRAVERWYQHLVIKEEQEGQLEAEKQEEEPEGELPRRVETKEERVARVLRGMEYLRMSADELRDVVEKSGLVPAEALLAAYRESALYHRMVLPCPLPTSTTPVELFDRVTIRDSQMAWYAKLALDKGQYIIYVWNKPQGKNSAAASGQVSYAGISTRLYLDRKCHAATFDDAEATRIEVVNTLNLADHGSRWISTSVFGNVYSFLSENILWWGSVDGTNIGIYGARIPPEFRPNLAVIIGFGLNPQTGHNIVELYSYSNTSNSVSFAVFDMNANSWIVNQQVAVPPDNYQYLIADSEDLNVRRSLFLISLNNIIYIDIPTFAVVAQMDLREQFVTQYPVNLVAGATYYKSNLFIARTASLGGQTLAQIVDIRVESDTNFHSLSFSHVVYLDGDCDNMFGWGNFLFWPQLRNGNGTLYGWDLTQRNLIFSSVGIGPGAIWGKGVGANQITNQALLVSGNPNGGGYTAWVAAHGAQTVSFIDSRPMPDDKLPALGIQTVNFSTGQQDGQLSVLLAGHNSTGFGKITWLRYT